MTQDKPRKTPCRPPRLLTHGDGILPVEATPIPRPLGKSRRQALPFDALLGERRKAIEQFVNGLFDNEREYLRKLLVKPARRPTKWSHGRRLQVLAEVDAALATGASREQALQMSADTHRVAVTEIERQLIEAKKLQARDGERLAPSRKKSPRK